MLIVATADWHLDRSTSGFRRFDDIVRAVTDSINAAIELEASCYLMLGDLCNPQNARSYRSIEFAIECFYRLSQHGIPSVWIVGNHDVIEDGSGDNVMLPLSAVGASVCGKPCVIQLAGLNVFALPFTPSSHQYDPAGWLGIGFDSDSDVDLTLPTIVAGHLSIEGIEPGSETEDMPRGRNVFWPVSTIEKMLPGALMVAGHYHRRQIYNGVHVVGALERLTHGEEANVPGYSVIRV